uniref:Uncharacterized protein n=1 Tax=Sinocyclocheilus rhinocerous TaxID=307959 RepID=A0A673LDF8_9TELE
MELSGSEEDFQQGALQFGRVRTSSTLSRLSRHSSKGGASSVSYRFGSVGQDTQFCLWDLTDDVLYPRLPLSRAITNTFGPTITSGSSGVEGHHHPSNPHQTSTLPLPLPRSLSRSNSLPHPAVANTSKSQGATESSVPLLEPLVCKKIAHERLTVLVFMNDCIITACQEGLICTWARPGKAVSRDLNAKHSDLRVRFIAMR